MHICLKNDIDNFLSADYKSAVFLASQVAEKYDVKIYLIGGIVRDLILKNPLKDIDITVEYDAIEFCNLLVKEVDCKIIAVQENLRTAKVQFLNGVEIDFASTREEKYTKSGVLPTAYNFGCKLENDVKRRDFTINTLAIALTGKDKFSLVDFYNGYDDILNKQIRVLHDKSFFDDPSRIIRALKFQKRFDFEIESKTKFLMNEYLDNVDITMPLERIKSELRQYFSINKSVLYSNIIETKAYKLICDNPIFSFDESAFEEIKRYNLFDSENNWFIYIVLLVINSESYYERLNLTGFEKKIIKEIKELLASYPLDMSNKATIYNAFKDKIDTSIIVYYLITVDKSVTFFLDSLAQINVLITGNDLIELGFIPSPKFNELFEKVLKEKIEGNLKTKEEEIKFVKRFLHK